MKTTIHKTACIDCPYYMVRDISAPNEKSGGVWLQPGERYCMAQKRPRQFRKKDPKKYIPDWCPKMLTPAVLRVYALDGAEAEYFYRNFIKGKPQEFPSNSDYYLKLYEPCKYGAHQFDDYLEETNAYYPHGTVLEIDDGVRPVFFFNSSTEGWKQIYFNKKYAVSKNDI